MFILILFNDRATASTHVHDKSSRSHAIFTITFIQAKVENEIPVEIASKLHLVDLAGRWFRFRFHIRLIINNH